METIYANNDISALKIPIINTSFGSTLQMDACSQSYGVSSIKIYIR